MFARFLFGQQASSDVRSNDLVGQVARVVVAIPAGGVGQIRCRLGEELVDKIARARGGDSIGENASVISRRSARRNRHRQETLKARTRCPTRCNNCNCPR